MTERNEDRTFDRLRQAILTLELLPGERLSERGLESLAGTSRTPIRAALMRLENEGLTRRRDRGWAVAPIDLAELRAVGEYREAVETAAAALAAERADDDRLAALRSVALANRDADDEEAGLRAGTDFHTALAALSGNRFLADAVAGAMTRLARTRWLEVRTPASRAHARDEHVAVADALIARDAGLAVDLIRSHTRGTRDRLLANLTDERLRLRGRWFAIVDG